MEAFELSLPTPTSELRRSLNLTESSGLNDSQHNEKFHAKQSVVQKRFWGNASNDELFLQPNLVAEESIDEGSKWGTYSFSNKSEAEQ